MLCTYIQLQIKIKTYNIILAQINLEQLIYKTVVLALLKDYLSRFY